MNDCDYAVVFPPNHPLSSVERQAVIYDEILFIDINNKGNTITGLSSISDNYWESTLFYYDSAQDANHNKSIAAYNSKSSVGLAKFFNDHTIFIAEDYLPSLKILSISDSKNITLSQTEDIEDRITSLSHWNHTSKAISSSGKYISIWIVQDDKLTLLNRYENYHFDIVNDVDTCKSNEHVFASVSNDKRAVLWDIRKETPAKVVYENEFSFLTTVAFDPSNEHLNYLGSEAGDIYTIDLRKSNDFVHVSHCYDAYGVHRMKINNNTDDGAMLAVCGDGPEIKVFDISNNGGLKTRYDHCSQSGHIVRDVAWSPRDVLYSCGFNQEFNEHFMK